MTLKKLCSTLAFLAIAGSAQAAIVTYDISVEVTAAPTAPGSFGATNPWDFSGVSFPHTYNGTFDADDTTLGPISNLNLTIGGLDIFTTHPNVISNTFNPNTEQLLLGLLDPTRGESFVGFGDLFGAGALDNYTAAIENNSTAPIDPFYFSTQNWAGTFSITAPTPPPPPGTTPEPTTLSMALLSLGLFAARYTRQRK